MLLSRPSIVALLTTLLLCLPAPPSRAQSLELGPTDVVEPGTCLALAPADSFDFNSLIGLPAEPLANRLLEALLARNLPHHRSQPHHSLFNPLPRHAAATSPSSPSDSFLALWRGLIVIDEPITISLGARVDDTLALRCTSPLHAAPIIAVAAPPVLGAPETWHSRVLDFPDPWRLSLRAPLRQHRSRRRHRADSPAPSSSPNSPPAHPVPPSPASPPPASPPARPGHAPPARAPSAPPTPTAIHPGLAPRLACAARRLDTTSAVAAPAAPLAAALVVLPTAHCHPLLLFGSCVSCGNGGWPNSRRPPGMLHREDPFARPESDRERLGGLFGGD